jgi:hypothetical protein
LIEKHHQKKILRSEKKNKWKEIDYNERERFGAKKEKNCCKKLSLKLSEKHWVNGLSLDFLILVNDLEGLN